MNRKGDESTITLDVGGSSVKSALVTVEKQIVGRVVGMPSKVRQLLMKSSGHWQRASQIIWRNCRSCEGLLFRDPLTMNMGFVLSKNRPRMRRCRELAHHIHDGWG